MATNIDPITLQVIRNALKAAAEEMQISLVKTAHNPLIYEVQDFGVALLNRKGELLAEGSGLPNFLGCLPPVIQSALNVVGADQFAGALRHGHAYQRHSRLYAYLRGWASSRILMHYGALGRYWRQDAGRLVS
jgi:hypothetical protein